MTGGCEIIRRRWNAFYNWLNENGLSDPELPENFGFTNDYLPE